jgi:hypothetical protein
MPWRTYGPATPRPSQYDGPTDRAPALRVVAEMYEERAVEEQERAASRRARRAQLKTQRMDRSTPAITRSPSGSAKAPDRSDGQRLDLTAREGHVSTNGHRAAPTAGHNVRRRNGLSIAGVEGLRRRVLAAAASGDRVTGDTVGQWLGVSARTGAPPALGNARRGPIPGTGDQSNHSKEDSTVGGSLRVVAIGCCHRSHRHRWAILLVRAASGGL